jgi:hypothetical protein
MGLGHFPTPHPDELLYSLCARFSACVGYSNAKAVPEELFGTGGAFATIDLPNNLGHLSAALPAGSSLTPERLTNQHTLLPFFSAFLPPERVIQLEADMRGGRGQAGYMRSGLMASRIPTPKYLRFCPVCIYDDRRLFREAYWHRTHQVSGVEICPTHQVFLEESGVSRRAGRDKLQFITVDEAARALPPRRIDSSDRDHQALLQIAHDAAWLLEHPISGSELSEFHSRYLRMLSDHGLATYTGSIHVTALLSEFTRHYSPSLLQLLHCKFTGSDQTKTNWLLKLVRPPKHAQHPLYHLLLIQLLGCTVGEFFQLADTSRPFGEGPWPCLNPAAAHYRQPVIQECQLGNRLRYGKPTGKFSCDCGFAYVRTGPDSAPEDRFHAGRIITFGQAWETGLKQLWRDSSLSVSEIGRRLGVDPLTIRRHAGRLELSLSRSDKRLKPLSRGTQLKGEAISASWEKKRLRCRSKWLSAMKPRQKITLKALRSKFPREYAWLRQNDSEWLEVHKPRPQRRNQPTAGVNWKRRDAEYAAAVRAVASRLNEAPGRPVQVTKTAIGRALGAITLLRQKLHKMPLTAQVLEGVVETREQYAVRRVWWATDLYCQEEVLPREWQLIMRANVYSLREISVIESAVKGAMSMLRSISQRYKEQAVS